MTELFGERLRRLREMRGLTMNQVAARLNVKHATVSHLEHGEQMIRTKRLEALARILNVSIDYLLTGRESPHLAALHRAVLAAPQQDARLVAMVRAAQGTE